MHVVFLTPLGGLAAFALLLPIGAVLLRERRDGRLRRALRLSPPARRVVPALAGAAVVACLAAAAAQPAISATRRQNGRMPGCARFANTRLTPTSTRKSVTMSVRKASQKASLLKSARITRNQARSNAKW